jgi:ferric-dicitrate binding protein FerR (iron transport regulator)
MIEEKLIRYIQGGITSDKEILKVLDWIESSPENQQRYSQLKNLWVITGLEYPEPIAIPAFPYPENENVFFQKRFYLSLLKYVAIFIIAFLLGSVSLYLVDRKERNQLSAIYNTIEVPYGKRSQITLYDGTKVWLNSGTTFKYPIVFSTSTRDVFIQGEAYFEVAKDSRHPFVVNSGQLKINVLGTHFNVCAYPDDSEFSATLDEGSVNAVNIMNNKGIKLNPGEQVVLDRNTNGMKLLKVNTELYTSWKEGMLKFENAPFDELIRKMERWYDVKIHVDPSLNTKEHYTMTIKTESLREMLRVVSKTTAIKYEIKENKVSLIKP